MDSLTQTHLHAEVQIARFRAEQSSKRAGADGARAHTSRQTSDSVEISTEAATSATINGVLNDSVVEQINKAIQEAGIDLRIETDGSFDVSPSGTARRIADFATGYLDAYSGSRLSEPMEVRINGFMSLIRGAIEDGFTHAKDFLSTVSGLSDTLSDSIDKTYALTQSYLSEFRSTQMAAAQPDGPAEDNTTGVEL